MADFDFTGPVSTRNSGFSFTGPVKRKDAARNEADTAIQATGLRQLFASGAETAASGLGMAGQVLDTPRRAVSGFIGGTIDNGGNPVEGLKSAVGDTFHPNDEESVDRHVDVQRAMIDPNYLNQVDRVNSGEAPLGEKASVLATRLGLETAEDPFTYGTAGLAGAGRLAAKGIPKAAELLGPSASSFIENAVVGSHKLDQAGIRGADKRGFQSIEEAEHQKYLHKFNERKDQTIKHLATDNPVVTPPELERDMGLFDRTDNTGRAVEKGFNHGPKDRDIEDLPDPSSKTGKELHEKLKFSDDEIVKNITSTVEGTKKHFQMMKEKPYADAYNVALKSGKDKATAAKIARDTFDSMDVPKTDGTFNDVKGPEIGDKAAAANAVKKAPTGRALFKGATETDSQNHLRNMQNPAYANEYNILKAKKKGVKFAIDGAMKAMRENAHAEADKARSVAEVEEAKKPEANPSIEHLKPNKFGKTSELQRKPDETDSEFAHRTFLHHLASDSDLDDEYQKAAKEHASFQEAASQAYRNLYLREYEKKVVSRAWKELGIDPKVAQQGIEALKDGDMNNWAKVATHIGNYEKSTMFINWLPHVFGNVAQNSFLSGGVGSLTKAAKYTMNPKSIPKQTMADMLEHGAGHSGFDKFDPVSEHIPKEPLLRAADNARRTWGKVTSKAQDLSQSTKMMNNAETGARAASWEDNLEKLAKEKGVPVDQLTKQDKLEVGSRVRRDIGDYRNPNRMVRMAKRYLGSQFPQYRAIALGVAARSAAKNPNRLAGIYRAQNETNKEFNPDGKVTLNLGGVANAANMAVSSPSEYLRGPSAVGVPASALLNIFKIPDNPITGAEPGSNNYGKDSYATGAVKQTLKNLPTANIPFVNSLIYDNLIHGGDTKDAGQHLTDLIRNLTGINQKHKMSAEDKERLQNWEQNGGDLESPENAPRKSSFSF